MTSTRALLLLAASIAVLAVSPAEAKHRNLARHHPTPTVELGCVPDANGNKVCGVDHVVDSSNSYASNDSEALELSAKKHHHHGGGKICGAVQAAYYHLDSRFNLARNYALLLPHTSAQPGAVVVQAREGKDTAGNPGGHVSRIESMVDQCHAMVTDEKGTYLREICHSLIAYVMPNASSTQAERPQRSRNIRVASSGPMNYTPSTDRQSVH